jgi:hypothetical protein
MSAVMVAPEYWWLESGSASNVEISGNAITDCGGTGIAVFAEGGRGKRSPAGSHNHIVISGNMFSGCPLPNICVTSTDDLRIERNAFNAPTTAKRPPFGLDPAKLAPVMTENCTNAVVKDNTGKWIGVTDTKLHLGTQLRARERGLPSRTLRPTGFDFSTTG